MKVVTTHIIRITLTINNISLYLEQFPLSVIIFVFVIVVNEYDRVLKFMCEVPELL